MRLRVLALLGLTLCTSLLAQAQTSDELQSVQAEHLRIENERARGNAMFSQQEQACQSKFVVTACMHDVGLERIKFLSELKRQEAKLNDAQRLKSGEEQRMRVQEKTTQRTLDEVQTSSSVSTTRSEKQQAQREKLVAHERLRSAEAPTLVIPKTRAGPDEAAIEQNRAAHAQKLQEANKRKSDREARLRKAPVGSTSLPVPP